MTTLLPDRIDQSKAIAGYRPGQVTIGQNIYDHSILMASNGGRTQWRPNSMAELTIEDLGLLQTCQQQLLIIGTGSTHHLPSKALKLHLETLSIPYEIMNSLAACRTYNMMLSDGRATLLALLIT